MSVIKYKDYLKEEATTLDSNVGAMQNNTQTYTKYQGKITSMFSNAKTSDDIAKVSKDFETFITSLPENEKGATDMLRALFSSEKIKVDINLLQNQKKEIEKQIQQRMKELQDMSAKLK